MKIFHGKIITCDENFNKYSYLVEDMGKIIYVGDSLPVEYENLETIELGEKALLPAFGDGHMHFSSFSLLNDLDIRDAESIPQQVEMISDYIRKNPRKKIYLAFGVSKHSVKEKRLITKYELDSASLNKPIAVICYDGHSAVFNSKLVDMFPDRIRKLHGFDGEKGQLFHEAFYEGVDFASKKVPLPQLIKSSLKGVDKLAEKGIGMAHVVEGVGFPADADVDLVRFIARGSQIDFKVFFQTMDVKKVLKRKLPRIGGCFSCALDGCYGALDAALIKPYTNDPGNRGILFYTDEEVKKFAIEANRKNLQIEFHAIGDAAFNQAVNSLEAALMDFPRKDHRHTIIHAMLTTPEGLEKCVNYGIGITLQPGFIHFPLEPQSYIEKILGKKRARANLSLRTILDSGIHVSGGSDGPVTYPDPIDGIYSACNHSIPNQSVTIEEALRMYTYEVAWTGFDEKNRGTLEQGKIADFVILNKNPLEMKKKELNKLQVESVLYSGEPYKSGRCMFSMIIDSIRGK